MNARVQAILSIAIVLVACSPGSASVATLPSPVTGTPTYEGTVSVDPATRSIHASWRISFVRTERTRDSVTFLLNDSLKIARLTGSEVLRYDERAADDMKELTVHLTPPASENSVTTIEIDYAGSPRFSSDSINNIGANWIELALDSFWHPVFDDFAQSIVARVRIDLPIGWQTAASGTFTRLGNSLELRSGVPLIDIAFAASPSLRHDDEELASIYHTGEEPALVNNVLTTTNSCSRYLNERYGARQQLPHVRMVIAPRDGPGYARKNYIVITRTADTASVPLTRFICHELAHFWSTNAISSGPENWLNEAFAEFVSARYVRSLHGQEAYMKIVSQWIDRAKGQPAIWTPAATRRPSAGTSYGKAPYLLHRLEERTGAEAMDAILARYMTESVATTAAFIQVVEDVAGAPTAAWFREQLATP